MFTPKFAVGCCCCYFLSIAAEREKAAKNLFLPPEGKIFGLGFNVD